MISPIVPFIVRGEIVNVTKIVMLDTSVSGVTLYGISLNNVVTPYIFNDDGVIEFSTQPPIAVWLSIPGFNGQVPAIRAISDGAVKTI